MQVEHLQSARSIGSVVRMLPRGFTVVRRAALSQWRFPENPGELPLYVQRTFRAKAFLLLSVQLVAVIVVMVLVQVAMDSKQIRDSLPEPQALFYSMGVVAVVMLLSLNSVKDVFPANYVFLVAATLTCGGFWGLTNAALNTWLQFQVISIMCLTMAFSAAASVGLSTQKMEPKALLLASVVPGWALASLIDLYVVVVVLPGSLHVSPESAPVAIFIALLLLAAVLVFDVGPLLIRCNPDEFMRVVISMNSALLLVVSIPIFIVSCCLLHSPVAWDTPEEEPASAAANPEEP